MLRRGAAVTDIAQAGISRVMVAKNDIHCINSNAVDSASDEGRVKRYGGLVIFLCGLSSPCLSIKGKI